MNILVDTHIIVWYLEGNSTLKMYWKDALENKFDLILTKSISTHTLPGGGWNSSLSLPVMFCWLGEVEDCLVSLVPVTLVLLWM